MNIFEAILQGAVQGLTEFLPVSSSGHLSITQHILGVQENNLFFNVMLHVGTLAAVCAVYFKLIVRLIRAFVLMLKDIFIGKFKWKEMNNERNLVIMLIIGLIPLFLLFLPIPGTDMKLKDLADKWTADGYLIIVAFSLLATSALLTLGNKKNENMTAQAQKRGTLNKNGVGRRRYTVIDAISVGVTQCIAALFPGLSRSGSTLAVSQLRGINKQTALDYSFVLGIPSIFAAAILEGKDVLFSNDSSNINIEFWPVLFGMITAAIVGFLAIKLFKWLLATDRMYIFILYTACVGGIMLIVSIIELFTKVNVFTGTMLNF